MSVIESQQSVPANTVIFVEDEKDVAAEVIELGAYKGFNIIHADSALYCLEIIQANADVDVVITDLRLPDISGIDLIRTIRSEFGERIWLQFIVLTGYGDLDVAREAMRLGAIDFLNKPFDVSDFSNAISKGIFRSKKFRRLESGQKSAHAANSMANCADTDGVFESASGGADVLAANDVEVLQSWTKRMVTLRTLKAELFSADTFADPCWDMLLELLLAELQNVTMTTNNLCMSAGIPVSTALRRITDLESDGYIERMRDKKDSRRNIVHLTQKSRASLQRYFALCGKNLL